MYADLAIGLFGMAFLFFLLVKRLTEGWLVRRNKASILANRHAVPVNFREKISLQEHQKAADYSLAKIKAGRFFGWLDLVILLFWTLGGGLGVLDRWVGGLSLSSDILHGVVFFALFGLGSTLLSLPESIYSTFVVEERFGFNKTTPKLFALDLAKGLLVGAALGLPLLAGLLWTMQSLGEYWWAYGWLFLTLFQLVVLWAYPRVIAPLFNRFSPLEEGEVKESVCRLLDKTGFRSNGLFVMDASIRSSHGNAYFTGLGKNKRIVFFDTLIKTLNASEVVAVLAHELGHFKKKHVLKRWVGSTVGSLVGLYILALLLSSTEGELFFEAHGLKQLTTHSGLVLFSLVAGVYTFFLTPLFSWWSRRHEFEADTFAAEHARAQDLIAALVKLYRDNASTLTPDHLYSAFYHSHPPALTRVRFLESL